MEQASAGTPRPWSWTQVGDDPPQLWVRRPIGLVCLGSIHTNEVIRMLWEAERPWPYPRPGMVVQDIRDLEP